MAKAILEEELRSAIRSVIDDGFQELNHWGEPRGDRKTIKQVVYETMHAKDGDRYDRNKGKSLIQRTLDSAVEQALKELVSEQIPPLKEQIQAQLDQSWSEAVIKAVREKFRI